MTTPNGPKPSRGLAIAALIVSILALAVSAFAAYHSRRASIANVALARPVLDITVTEPVVVDDKLSIPLELNNIGKSGASITSVQLVKFETEDDKSGTGTYYYYNDLGAFRNIILRPGGSARRTITIERFQDINGVSFDLSKGVGQDQRLRFKLKYKGMELDDETFTADIQVPVEWKEYARIIIIPPSDNESQSKDKPANEH